MDICVLQILCYSKYTLHTQHNYWDPRATAYIVTLHKYTCGIKSWKWVKGYIYYI